MEEFAPSYPNGITEDVCGVPSRPVQEDTSNFHFALGLWCDKECITRNAYNGLLEALLLLKVADVLSLPRRLGTLQKWCRRRLPLPPIQHQKVIAVKTEKQPSRIAKSSESNMYFFDMRIILSSILSTNERACLSY